MPASGGNDNGASGGGASDRRTCVCILAAGIARRLEPISAILAKPALPLAGRVPIVELWVRRFVEYGAPRMAMNLHRVPESVRGHFKDGAKYGAEITYVDEETPSGTLGGAIKMVKALRKQGLDPQRVFIPSGDIVSGIGAGELQEMERRHVEKGAAFTVMLAPIPWQRRKDFGTVTMEGIEPNEDVAPGTYRRVTEFIEKMADSPSNENNASNYLVETEFLLSLEPYLTEARVGLEEPCYDFGKHVLMGMTGRVPYLEFLTKRAGDLYGYEPGKPWVDVGQKRDYLEVNRAVLNGEIAVEVPYERTEWGWVGDNVDLDPKRVKINGPVIIGNDCVIGPGSELGPNVVLASGWVVKGGATIRDSVFWPFYGQAGIELDPEREVGEGVTVESAIAVCGRIGFDLREETAYGAPDGELTVASIDWVPDGDRA